MAGVDVHCVQAVLLYKGFAKEPQGMKEITIIIIIIRKKIRKKTQRTTNHALCAVARCPLVSTVQ